MAVFVTIAIVLSLHSSGGFSYLERSSPPLPGTSAGGNSSLVQHVMTVVATEDTTELPHQSDHRHQCPRRLL
jgi:hypothetical protein